MTQVEGSLAPRLRPGREIVGMSAVLLPFITPGEVDWPAFERLVAHTVDAGLTPAVNMDTGYVQFIDESARRRVLEIAEAYAGPRGFLAGAFVADEPGRPFDLDSYLRSIEPITVLDGTPVVFPSYGLNALDDEDWVRAHDDLGRRIDRFVAFELGSMFVPYGRIYSLAAYEGLLSVDACIAAKHSSLSRVAEWDRLAVRDRVRPDFRLLTGNDLAIDMVCYGSDYLLGLSAFAPEAFAERDRRWAHGESSFYELNDLLQYLGFFAFRPPVPAYRHDAAMFNALRGRIACDATPCQLPRRPDSDRAILADIAQRLDALL
jgi:hypothetical protein